MIVNDIASGKTTSCDTVAALTAYLDGLLHGHAYLFCKDSDELIINTDELEPEVLAFRLSEFMTAEFASFLFGTTSELVAGSFYKKYKGLYYLTLMVNRDTTAQQVLQSVGFPEVVF